jgi:hypothetical protein
MSLFSNELLENFILLGKAIVKLIAEATWVKLGYAGKVALNVIHSTPGSGSKGEILDDTRFENTNTTVKS